MEFGDLLYVFIMVAVAVFGIIKKSAGKKRPDVLMPEFEAENSPVEVFPTGRFWEETVKPLTKPPEIKNEKVRRPDFKRIDFDRSKIKKRTITSSLKKRQSAKIFLEEDEQNNFSFWEKEQFDLQKAVIFSEILKKPEYRE